MYKWLRTSEVREDSRAMFDRHERVLDEGYKKLAESHSRVKQLTEAAERNRAERRNTWTQLLRGDPEARNGEH